MSEGEEIIELYIPDDPTISQFHSLSGKEKIRVIRLGLTFLEGGTQKLQCWENDQWETQLKDIKASHESEKTALLEQTEIAQAQFRDYQRASKLRQETLIDEVRGAEQERAKEDLGRLKMSNSELTSRVEKLLADLQSTHTALDTKYNQRLIDARDFYEGKLTVLQEKFDTLVARGQNSTLKGQEGEEYVFGKLNMLFPLAEIEDSHKIPARGDFIMRQEGFTMMIETKNYSKNVQKSEVDKFYRDIDNPANTDVQCAVFVSLHTGICCKEDFAFEIRNMIPILFIHNLHANFTNLILAVKFFKLIIDQTGLDLSDKAVIDAFKNLASTLKRNFAKQRSKLDRFHTDQTALLAEQECKIAELYQLAKLRF